MALEPLNYRVPIANPDGTPTNYLQRLWQILSATAASGGGGGGSGTVTSVSGTGTVSGLTLSGTVTTSGNLTLGGTLAVTPSNFASQTANTFLAAPNGSAGVPTFRTIVAADVPTLNQNTTGTASNVTGVVAVANGGTGVTSSTGTTSVVLSNSPTLVTPTLGAASATSITNGLGAVGTPSYTFTGDTNTGMWSPGADTVAVSTAGSERLRVDSSGNAGIGTTSLSSGYGTGKSLMLTNQSSILIQNSSNTWNNSTAGGSVTYFSDNNMYIDAKDSGSNIIFRVNGTSERVRIASAGNVGIGTSSPNAAAQLDVSSTTRGFLPPRMTTAQRDLIGTPPDGLVLYNTTLSNIQARAGGAWVTLGGGGSGDVVGPASATDNAIARYDATTGKLIQNSAATVSDDGIIRSATNSGANAVSVPLVNWIRLSSNYTLTSTTAEQKLFGTSANGALTLPSGMYYFDCWLYVTLMSATSGNMAFDPIGAGTATADRFGYNVVGLDSSTSLNAAGQAGSASVTQQTVASMVSAGVGTQIHARIGGMFRVTATGTIIPSVTLVTAAAAVVQAGTWFRVEKIGESGDSFVGAWT